MFGRHAMLSMQVEKRRILEYHEDQVLTSNIHQELKEVPVHDLMQRLESNNFHLGERYAQQLM